MVDGKKLDLSSRRRCLICSPFDGKTGPRKLTPDEKKLSIRKSDLKRLYGITLEDFENMQARQNNKCAICGVDPPESNKRRLSIDHCHITGDIRGLLCTRCNTMLGWFETNREAVESYL